MLIETNSTHRITCQRRYFLLSFHCPRGHYVFPNVLNRKAYIAYHGIHSFSFSTATHRERSPVTLLSFKYCGNLNPTLESAVLKAGFLRPQISAVGTLKYILNKQAGLVHHHNEPYTFYLMQLNYERISQRS